MGDNFLPIIPRIIIGIIDPLLVTMAAVGAIVDPSKFISDHVPNTPLPSSHVLDLHTRVVTATMANYLFGVAPVLVIAVWVNKSASVFRWLVVTNMILEFWFLYALYTGVGEGYFWNPSQWNGTMWARVGIPVGLNVSRLLTLLEVFGPLRGEKVKHA